MSLKNKKTDSLWYRFLEERDKYRIVTVLTTEGPEHRIVEEHFTLVAIYPTLNCCELTNGEKTIYVDPLELFHIY